MNKKIIIKNNKYIKSFLKTDRQINRIVFHCFAILVILISMNIVQICFAADMGKEQGALAALPPSKEKAPQKTLNKKETANRIAAESRVRIRRKGIIARKVARKAAKAVKKIAKEKISEKEKDNMNIEKVDSMDIKEADSMDTKEKEEWTKGAKPMN